MSSMRVSREEDIRMCSSRDRLIRAFFASLGSYIEQEAKKMDEWRDKSLGEIYAHLKHEIAEIGRSSAKTTMLHNCMDACILSAMMVSKLLGEDE